MPHFVNKHELDNELLTLVGIERTPTRRGRHDAWKAVGFYDGIPVPIDVFPEDVRLMKDAGYDTAWTASQQKTTVSIDVILKWTQKHGYRIGEVVSIRETITN